VVWIRSSGVILHISSLPSRHGIGDLGQSAYQWIDFLDQSGTGFWQILPLNPTGFGESPYQALSTHAGNPDFINPDLLVSDGLLSSKDILISQPLSDHRVDFRRMRKYKAEILVLAFSNFKKGANRSFSVEFQDFQDLNHSWLLDFSTFMAIRMENRQKSWKEWPVPLKFRQKSALQGYQRANAEEILWHSFLQFLFHRQWNAVKSYANQKGIRIIGDIPIYVGFDSADVWANPHLFQLDNDLNPLAVAGVPPDFFSSSGQLWGNPLYDWPAHKHNGYQWWINRIRTTLTQVDVIRLDHFRGFAGYWHVPAGSETAADGEWKEGPGSDLFDAIESEIGNLPFIAEDLGVITPDVVELRDALNLPGMKVLQFAFGNGTENEYLPHHYERNCIAYTGTHDNEPSRSWFASLPEQQRQFCLNYVGGSSKEIAHAMIRAIWQSPAIFAIAPFQDFLQVGSSGRMNLPGSAKGNWRWRLKPDQLTDDCSDWMKRINITFGRVHPNKNWSIQDLVE
jgi:4-alpha-glucanotransferase